MAQHFLASAKFRDLKVDEIDSVSEKEAHQYLANIRWGCNGQQICPACGLIDNHYWRKHRQHWRCKNRGCEKEFSATQGTPLHGHKLAIKKILKAIFLYVTEMKGCSALALSRRISVSTKTAWVLIFKIRESFYFNQDTSLLKGVVQADGAYFCGKRRDANKRGCNMPDRTSGIQQAIYHNYGSAPSGRQKRARQFAPGGKANALRRKNRRVVLVLRELSKNVGAGATKTRVTIAKREHESEAMPFIQKNIEQGSLIMTDENSAYNQLAAEYCHKTVQHSLEYQTDEGINNNQAESFNSRMRRAEYGVYHGYRYKYLMFYASETAWLEDYRRSTLRERFNVIAEYLTQSRLSKYFRGYWQGHHLRQEILGA